MNVSNIPTTPAVTQPIASPEAKRAAFQAALLRKSLELQDQQVQEIAREEDGKGQMIDIRV